MAVDKVDYTNFFRLLSNIKADPTIPQDELLTPLKAVLLDIGKERKESWISWVQSYIQEVLITMLFAVWWSLADNPFPIGRELAFSHAPTVWYGGKK